MRKLTFLACATLLTSAVVFTGCNNDKNDPAKVPTVTTDIAISLPAQLGGNGAVRHMPGITAQTGATGDVYDEFAANHGMTNIVLIPFAKREPVSTASKRLGANINLGVVPVGIDETDTHSNQDGKGRTKLFTNAQVPNGTSAFLFYGESGNNDANNFVRGRLNSDITSSEPAAYSFSLQPILTNIAGATTSDAAYTNLIAYLNLVANAENKESDAADYASKTKWYEYTTALNEGYTELFDTYKSLKVLSSFGIQRMMTDLYKTLMLNAVTDTLANNIKEAISNSTYASVDGSGNVTLVSSLQNYPQKHGLPVGAVAVAWDNTNHQFVGNSASSYGQSNVLAPNQLDRYVYPASLWYFANSTIKTSTTKEAEHYADGASWADILAQYDNKYSVNSTTRSIALVDTIQYAVARFDVSVKIGGTDNALVDNNPVTTANKVANPAGGYAMKAVLVGGQKNVGFDFTPATYPGTSNEYVIYDSLMTSNINAIYGAYSAANPTLVLETAANQDIVIAVEFVNTSGVDFYGKDGIVPAGGRFYLVGKLPAASATRTENKVFKQDYTTIANITIPNLQNAYNVIPDLRAPQLEIGMLVDLYWKAGTTYEINFD